MQTKEQRQFRIKFSAMIVLLLIVVLAAISIGQYAVTPLDMIKSISNRLFDTAFQYDINTDTILYRVRLPRILLGIPIDSGLSCAGATYQGLFQNPMVSPDLLGASWGAGFGAALGLLFSLPYVWISVIAFAFGLLAVYLTYFVGAHCKGSKKLGFILGGIMIGSLFSAGVSYIKLAADPMDTLPAITYWLMGSLASARPSDVYLVIVPMLAGMIPIVLMRWRINLLSLGDAEARSMGIQVKKTRLIFICCATLITSAAVSVSGMIGWVGLVIPHLSRMLVGSDNRRVIPMSLVMGAIYLLLVDTVARTIATIEIPLGILTAVLGSPFLLYLIVTSNNQEYGQK